MKTILIGVFLRDQSALSEYFLKMASTFVDLGYRVIIISDEDKKEYVKKNHNPMILTWPSYHPNRFQDFLFIRKLIKIYKPEMLIGNFTSVNLFMIAGKLYGVPHRIAWIHSISSAFQGEIPYWKTYRKKFIYKLATKIICNSNATKIDAIHSFGIKENKITVLDNLIKNNNKYLKNQKVRSIIFVGRCHKSKGIDILLKAFSLVQEKMPDLKLNIIAGGNCDKYIKLAEELKISNNIIFLGKLSRSDVIQYFSISKLSVVPSLFEAFGYTVVESMSVATPVIGSNTGGIAEIIENNENGLLFNVGDFQELAEKIFFLLESEENYVRLSRNAYESFLKHYDLNNNIDKHVNKLIDFMEK